ncbi:lysylphosphatidylglycerol synthase transmembrane domain-containing protein [Marinilabilia salmonicolor]|uniref:lysylphosphatidylglycerol synthase transmembrane domain-containing protein n=1 Tax=Marinilabilia salmonicolor TaxID=989 RepID=UPI00029B0625|nr:lysylphosphatidylglycerol synthase transmembrane domain-containing protein [Marinilabilia salmonicolor]
MNKSIQKGLRILLFLSIGIIIIWWLYRDINPDELLRIMKHDVGYGWIVLSLILGLLSHISRTIRWQMLIEPVDKRPGVINTFLAVMIGYLANLAIPRMGEISRCGVLSKYEKVSFSRLVGTVVTERVLDLIMLLLALALMISVQYNVFVDFVNNKMDISGIVNFFSSWWFGLIVLFAAGSIIVFRQNILNSQMYFKLKGLWLKFKEGLFSYKNVKNKPLFFIHTLLIFVLYFLMIYVCFFGFPFTRDLGPGAGLAVFVLGSFGMVAPVQGGIGPYHFMVISTLLFFGVGAPQAAAFALLVHGSLNGMIIITGLLSLVAIPLVNKNE